MINAVTDFILTRTPVATLPPITNRRNASVFNNIALTDEHTCVSVVLCSWQYNSLRGTPTHGPPCWSSQPLWEPSTFRRCDNTQQALLINIATRHTVMQIGERTHTKTTNYATPALRFISLSISYRVDVRRTSHEPRLQTHKTLKPGCSSNQRE